MKHYLSSLPVMIFVFLVSVYMLVQCRTPEYGYADGAVMYRVTESIMEDGSFTSRVAGVYRSGDIITHSRYGLGFSLAIIPAYLTAKEIGILSQVQDIQSLTRRSPMFTNSIITALTGVILFLILLKLFSNKRLAVGLSLVYGLSTLAASYSVSDFSEPLTTLFLIAAFNSILLLKEEPSDLRAFFWCGLFLGLALFTRIAALITLPIFLTFIFWPQPRFKFSSQQRHQLGTFLFPVIIILGIYLWYNYVRYNSFFNMGYGEDLANHNLGRIFFIGLYGLTTSLGKGIFWYNPILIFSLIGIPVLMWKNIRLGIFISAFFLIHLLVYAAWPAWEGGWCWGPRNLVPVIPFLFIPLGFYLDRYDHWAWPHYICSGLFSVGIGVQFLGLVYPVGFYIQHLRSLQVPFEEIWIDPFYTPLIGHLRMVIDNSSDSWDFFLIKLWQLPNPLFFYGWITVWPVLIMISGYRIIRLVMIPSISEKSTSGTLL